MLPTFLHAKSPLEPATDYILCTRPPFYLGKVIQFKQADALKDFIADKNAKGPFVGAQVQGYNILVVYAGSLSRWQMMDDNIFEQMAADYLTNRIKQREQRFKRYKTEGNGI
jgi:hypothetical protein